MTDIPSVRGLTYIRERAYTMRVNVKRIKALRNRKGLTMATAARLSGLKTIQRWSDLENGRHKNPRAFTLAAVARVLGCKVDELLLR